MSLRIVHIKWEGFPQLYTAGGNGFAFHDDGMVAWAKITPSTEKQG
jgi:hypothetical protein